MYITRLKLKVHILLLLFLWGFIPTSSHFIWLVTNEQTATLTFSETAGSPGPKMLLDMVANKSHLWAQTSKTTRSALRLREQTDSPEAAALVSALTLKPPYLLEAFCTFGIFGPHSNELLKYYANADAVTRPNDWFGVQDMSKAELEITLRDPWMIKSPATAFSSAVPMAIMREIFPTRLHSSGSDMPPGYQCPQGESTFKGDACVVAVVRFNGELISADCNVTTYASNGTKIGTTFLPASASGVALVRVPLAHNGLAFASVNYRQPKSGTYNGQPYETIDHWATTSLHLKRS